MWSNRWKKGVDYPEWADAEVYKKTITGGYLYNGETPKEAYERVAKAAAKRLNKPELEEKYIDKMFEMGDLENLTKYDLKQFIRKRTNEKLKELGYKEIFEFDDKGAKNLDWFYHLTGGHTHTDFFAIRPTDYSKANEGEDFENIW